MRCMFLLFVAACGADPAPSAPTLSPPTPRAGIDALTCSSRSVVSWTLDGAPVAVVGSVVEPWELKAGRWACTGVEGTSSVAVRALGGNIMVVLLDDIGVDATSAWGLHPDTPPTPTLDRLVEEGVRFNSAYSMPICSPTRGAMLTGKLPGRTGLGHLIELKGDTDWLEGHSTFAQHLRDAGYATAVFGKWHLSPSAPEYLDHPKWLGFDIHQGTMDNPNLGYDVPGVLDYFRWQENRDGAFETKEGYLTTSTVDDAVKAFAELPEPWLVYVPFNGAHVPLHRPPDDLWSAGPLVDDVDTFAAVVEATDAELGRLIDGLGPLAARTTLIVLSDNGTNDVPMVPPSDPDRAKGSVYEGGTQVPMVVVGPWVERPGTSSEALVHVTDIYASVLDLAGVRGDDQKRDSLSILPYVADPGLASRRKLLYTESFRPNGRGPHEKHRQMIRNADFMLVRGEEDVAQLFRLEPDTLGEGEALVDPETNYADEWNQLADAMDALVEDMLP